MTQRLKTLLLNLFLVVNSSVIAQTIPVGMPVIEDYYRQLQLEGRIDSTVSFMVRPLTISSLSGYTDIFKPDSNWTEDSWLRWDGKKTFAKEKAFVRLLPVSWEQQVTTHHPYGWNDGSMILSRGYQTRFSAGVFMKFGHLSLQLRPEFLFAENKDFEGFNTEHDPITWNAYYRYYLNVTDIPEKFGDGAYSRAFWGQSSVKLTFDPVSIGISNENLWWGPGKRSSLIMSNNASGFKHITLNTTKPVSTFLGAFEAQMIAGRLEASGYLPPEPNRVISGQPMYWPKVDDWRYLSGITAVYQPKWVPGLFLGLNRVFQIYEADLGNSIADYIPILEPFQKDKVQNEDDKQRDQLLSVFGRYLLRESKAEVYFEFGRNDHSANLRDFLMEPEHSRAYLVGFSKLIPLKRSNGEYILANLEVTELSQPAASLYRDAGSWYVHGQVRHGYTNEGQVLGAGIGPGSNLQSLNVQWVKGVKKIGLQFERYIHNNDFYFEAFKHTSDWRKRWVDLSATAMCNWDYKNLLFNANLSVIRSLNYQYFLIDSPDPTKWLTPGRDLFNFTGQLGVMYRF